MANGNKEYRSDVFSMLLQNKKRALEIYNAINGTAYDDPEQIEITTLEDRSFSLTVRNDASFVLDHQFSLYEHQSTLCPNMPLRDLIYFLSMIQKRAYAKRRDLSCAVAIQYIFVIDVVSNKGIRNLKGVEYFTKLI